MASIGQKSFAGGELAPLLHGRHDLAKYATGLKLARNFFISRQGSAVSRPGTKFIKEVKDSTKRVRLVPFIFSDDQAFCLEFGDLYIRFYTNGAIVESSPGVAYELVSPFAVADLPYLKFAQAGDVITITQQNYNPVELRRLTDTHWTTAFIGFAAPDQAAPAGNTFTASYVVPGSFSAWSNVTTYAAGALVAYGGANWLSIFGANTGNTPGGTNGYWLQIGANSGREWVWAVTALVQIDGVVVESAPVTHAPGAVVPLSQDSPAVITIAAGAGAGAGANQYQLWGVRIYRGVGQVYGFIGAMTSAGAFTDVGADPDYTQQPPQSADPFTLYTPGGGPTFYRRKELPAASADYPACVAIYEQRRHFANMVSRPSTILSSETGNYFKFDDALIPTAPSSLNFTLDSLVLAQIRSLVHFQKLLAFTGTGVWAVSGGGGAPMAYNSIDAKLQTQMGASWLTPVTVEDSVLYARSKGTGVRELVYDFVKQKFSVGDASLFSEHLFTGQQVVDWAFAEDPWQLVWAVMDNGKLLSFTYAPEEEVRAWTWHDTDGTFENVCAVPNGTKDDVYVVVKRTINSVTKRYVEILANRVFDVDTDTSGVDVVCLDASVHYTGVEATALGGLLHLEGKSVYVLADGGKQGPFTVGSGIINLDTAASNAVIGLAYTPQLQLLDAVIAGAEVHSRQKSVRRTTVDVFASRGLWVGPDFDNLVEWRQRTVSDEFNAVPLETGIAQLDVQGVWDGGGTLCIQQNSPLPLTITGVLREVDFGDD